MLHISEAASPPPPAPLWPAVDAATAKRLLLETLENPPSQTGYTGWEPPEPDEVSPLFAKYRISRLLGRGGMGAVYLGTDPSLDRPVAIKILPAELDSLPGFADRFRREAWALAQLAPPHIVHIYEFGTTGSHLFFVMKYAVGVLLYEMLTGELPRGAFPLPSHYQPLDRRLDSIILRALQAVPGRRFATISDLGAALQPLRRTGGRRRPRWPLAAGLPLTAAAATAVYLKLAASPEPVIPAPRTGLVFEESFDYPPGDDGLLLVPRYGTEGAFTTAADITETGLSYTDPQGNVLTTRGRAANLDSPDEQENISHVTALLLPDGPEHQLWISFLALQTAGTHQRFLNLCLRAVDDASQPPDDYLKPDEVLAIGMRSRLGPQVWQIWDRGTFDHLSRAAISDQPTTQTAFLLVRWEKDADRDNERATLWVNPSLAAPPPKPQVLPSPPAHPTSPHGANSDSCASVPATAAPPFPPPHGPLMKSAWAGPARPSPPTPPPTPLPKLPLRKHPLRIPPCPLDPPHAGPAARGTAAPGLQHPECLLRPLVWPQNFNFLL